jgi:hypothetical protein
MIDIRLYGANVDGVTNDATIINNALLESDIILRNGVFLISSSILLPSNRYLYLENCKLILANESYDNMIRNLDCLNGNSNIHIIGLGNVVLDHNGANNWSLNYAVYGGKSNTSENLYKANTLFFCNVDTFSITGLEIVDHPHYAGCLQGCSWGIITGLFFNHYSDCQNQDGIQLIFGTHDISFERLYGRTGDDFVSIFLGTYFGTLFYPLFNFNHGDCFNISWKNLIVRSTYHVVVFICGDGNKIYNITGDEILIIYSLFLSYFGYSTYVITPPTKEEFKDISFDNVQVESNAADYVVDFRNDCKNVLFTNFINNSGKTDYMLTSGDQTDNVKINGVQVS